jgi:hypothetical protein
MLGGQDKNKKTDSKSTGLTDSNVGLTGAPTGLTGTQISLTDVSPEPGDSSKSKTRPSFKELLAKYQREGATQKKKNQPDEVKDAKSSSRRQEQSVSCPHQGNCVAAPYGPIAP